MASSEKRYAIATLVMLGDSYVAGALALAWSLRMCDTKCDLVVMVNGVSEQGRTALGVLFDEVIDVPLIEARALQKGNQKAWGMYEAWIDKSFTKFNVLALSQFDKVMLLDADQIALDNVDHLVRESRTPAGICSWIGGAKQAVGEAEDKQWHGQRLPESTVLKSLQKYGIRGSCYIFSPCAQDLDEIREHLKEKGVYGDKSFYLGADERLMTQFYAKRWRHVHHRYGWISWRAQREFDAKPAILHFVTEKPWKAANKSSQEWPDFAIWDAVAWSLIKAHPQLESWMGMDPSQEAPTPLLTPWQVYHEMSCGKIQKELQEQAASGDSDRDSPNNDDPNQSSDHHTQQNDDPPEELAMQAALSLATNPFFRAQHHNDRPDEDGKQSDRDQDWRQHTPEKQTQGPTSSFGVSSPFSGWGNRPGLDKLDSPVASDRRRWGSSGSGSHTWRSSSSPSHSPRSSLSPSSPRDPSTPTSSSKWRRGGGKWSGNSRRQLSKTAQPIMPPKQLSKSHNQIQPAATTPPSSVQSSVRSNRYGALMTQGDFGLREAPLVEKSKDRFQRF